MGVRGVRERVCVAALLLAVVYGGATHAQEPPTNGPTAVAGAPPATTQDALLWVAVTSHTGPAAANARIQVFRGARHQRNALHVPSQAWPLRLAPGVYRVRVSAPGYVPQERVELLGAAERTTLRFRLNPCKSRRSHADASRLDATTRLNASTTWTADAATRVAGARGDSLMALRLAPGMGVPAFGSNALLIRGTGAGASSVQWSGLPLTAHSHLGGQISTLHPQLTSHAALQRPNFSARYGRHGGGIIVLTPAARRPLHPRLQADTNLLDASVFIEAPLQPKWVTTVTARRSHMAYLGINPFATRPGALQAPQYHDFHWATGYRPSRRQRLSLYVFGSGDRLERRLDALPVPETSQFVRHSQQAQLHWSYSGKAMTFEVQLSAARLYQQSSGEAFRTRVKGTPLAGRAEWRLRASPQLQFQAGLDLYAFPGHLAYEGPTTHPGQHFDIRSAYPRATPDPTTQTRLSSSHDFRIFQPAVYAEALISLRPLYVTVGQRVDYDWGTREFSFDPRVNLDYVLNRNLRLEAGFGLYSQPPDVLESTRGFGNPELTHSTTVRLSTGASYRMLDPLTFSVRGYLAQLDDQVVPTTVSEPPYYTNDGGGQAYGAELGLQLEAFHGVSGFIAYTLSRSERKSLADPVYAFEFDRPHVFATGVHVQWGSGWRASATFRLASGLPYTPGTSAGSQLGRAASYDLEAGRYVPAYGDPFSRRLPLRHQLDVHLEKQWRFAAWQLTIYLDVQNAYYARNSLGHLYPYDYASSRTLVGPPLIPSLGLRGEL